MSRLPSCQVRWCRCRCHPQGQGFQGRQNQQRRYVTNCTRRHPRRIFLAVCRPVVTGAPAMRSRARLVLRSKGIFVRLSLTHTPKNEMDGNSHGTSTRALVSPCQGRRRSLPIYEKPRIDSLSDELERQRRIPHIVNDAFPRTSCLHSALTGKPMTRPFLTMTVASQCLSGKRDRQCRLLAISRGRERCEHCALPSDDSESTMAHSRPRNDMNGKRCPVVLPPSSESISRLR